MSTKDIKDIVRFSPEGNFNNFKNKVIRYFKKEHSREEILDKGYDVFLWNFYKLFTTRDILKDISYLHIVKGLTYEDISLKKGVNKNTIRTTIYRDIKRVYEVIGYNPIQVVKDGEVINEEYESSISYLMKTYQLRQVNIEDNLKALDLDFKDREFDREFNAKIDDSDFEELIEVLKYYSKPYRNFLSKNVSKQYKGYVDYLLTTDKSELTQNDKIRREELKHELMLDSE